MANLTVLFNFSPTDPRCHGNEIWNKMGYNSACVRDFCAYRGVFGDAPSNAANRIFPRPTPVAMATKFGTKWAITRLAQEIFAPIQGFSVMGHRMLPIATKFGTQLAITRSV